MKMKLQPDTPPEVCEKREIKLKSGMENISTTLAYYGKLFYESLQI